MKIHKCGVEAVATTMSYEQIQKEEGIYEITTYAGNYLVVIKGGFGTVVFFVSGDRIEVPSTSWATAQFTKSSKKLHLEIR